MPRHPPSAEAAPPLRQASLPPDLVRDIAEGRCVLFAGAGFSLPVTGLTWRGLMEALARELPGVPREEWDSMEPLDQAQLFVDERGRAALEALLKAALPNEDALDRRLRDGAIPDVNLRETLVGLPFPYIFTTNYDALIEVLLSRARVPHTVLVDDDQVLVDYPQRMRRVVKVHGDLELSDTIILSRDDYLDYRRLRPGMYRLWQSLLVSHTFLFFGFGLTDPNFRLLYHDLSTLLPRDGRQVRAYAFMAGETPARVAHWRRRGLYIVESRDLKAQDKKVQALVQRVQDHRRRRDDLPHLLAALAPPAEAPPAGDRATLVDALAPVRDQLRVHVEALWQSLPVPEALRHGTSVLPRWDGSALVDVPPRDRQREEQAELLFNAMRLMGRITPELARFDGPGPLGPPVSALLGALLYRAQRWEEAIEALEETRFALEARAGGVPWWLARMLGRASRRAGDRPSAWEFLRFSTRLGGRLAPMSVAAASDASLLMDVGLTRITRLRDRARLDLARTIAADALLAVAPVIPWLETGRHLEDLYGRRTAGYGSWHLGELLLEDGLLRVEPPHDTISRALPHLERGRELLPVAELQPCLASLERRLREPLWAATGHRLRLLLERRALPP